MMYVMMVHLVISGLSYFSFYLAISYNKIKLGQCLDITGIACFVFENFKNVVLHMYFFREVGNTQLPCFSFRTF